MEFVQSRISDCGSMAPVENAPVVTADLAAGRHLNDQQRAAKKNTHVLSVWIGIKCMY